MSRLAVALVVLLVSLAGCSGLSDEGGPPDREPYGVDEPVNPSIEDGSEGLLLGLTTEGVTNPDALFEGHHEAIADTPYTIETETVYVTETENGTVRQVIEGETYVDPEAGVALESNRQYTEGNGSEGAFPDQRNRTVERWFGTETLARTESENGRVGYPYMGWSYEPMEWVAGTLLGALETVGNTTTVGAVEAEDGRYYVVEGRGNRSEEFDGTSRVRIVDVRALVRDDGLIRQVVSERAVERTDGRTVVDSSVEVTGVGETSVERPAWYDDALEAQPEEPDT
ncbi:hypothetical protein [Saliphagus sp. LR7]|uniref:hypothetical protein n=1 Tax=Saliphagus sp. LR7 TaxID=2282654 RepID=UPI000DF7C8ED|nr:hypothetical protein [Saliphagus sp. LR7]